jgi:comEA protein
MNVKRIIPSIVTLALLVQLYTAKFGLAEEFPIGARSLGMGGTFVGLANSSDAVFLNPGGLSQLSGIEISLFYQKPYGVSDLNFGTLTATFPLWQRRVSVGFLTLGNGLYTQQMIALGYSHHYRDKLYYGVSVRYQGTHIDGYGSGGAVGLDFGVVVPISAQLKLGFAAKNLNRPTIGKSDENLPQTFNIGASVQPLANALFNFEIFKDVRFAPEFRFGTEFRPMENLALRAGTANQPSRFSAGFGVNVKLFSVDYAFFTHNDLGLTHQFSFSIHLEKKRPAEPETPPVAERARKIEPPAVSPADSAKQAIAQKININTATMEELKMLPGVGEKLALAIIEFRTQNGPFQQLDDILKVPGIGKKKLEQIKDQIVIGQTVEK